IASVLAPLHIAPLHFALSVVPLFQESAFGIEHLLEPIEDAVFINEQRLQRPVWIPGLLFSMENACVIELIDAGDAGIALFGDGAGIVFHMFTYRLVRLEMLYGAELSIGIPRDPVSHHLVIGKREHSLRLPIFVKPFLQS